MVGQIFDDIRRVLLGLLFVLSFGWMAAQIVPGATASPASAPAPVQNADGHPVIVMAL